MTVGGSSETRLGECATTRQPKSQMGWWRKTETLMAKPATEQKCICGIPGRGVIPHSFCCLRLPSLGPALWKKRAEWGLPREQTEYHLNIPGQPVPWSVYTRRGPPSNTFLAMQAWQETIRAAVIQKYGRPLLKVPVRLECVFFLALPGLPPKSQVTWERRMRKEIVKHRDTTNYLKACEDALKGTLLEDDCYVVITSATKWVAPLGQEPYTQITVATVDLGGS